MTNEITHRRDADDGHMVQIVSPERLREILDADGETYDPPSGFGPADEWDVASGETGDIDDDDIRALRTEAGEAGDLDQVALCDAALAGDEAARQECVEVILEARAQS